VRAGVIAYAYEDKTTLLGVPADLIVTHGAVSEPVAVAMAEGIRERTNADVTIGITGIAGPGGGTPTKPVGTVVIAVIVPDRPVYVRTYLFFGGRAMVKFQAAQAALDRVRRMLSDARG
jgi:nicotinamide-nucleotide amidase